MRAWEEFLALQERELGNETVQKWLKPLKLIHFDACNLYLEAGNSFTAAWFEEHMRGKVQKGLYNNNHKSIKVHITIADQSEQEKRLKLKKNTSLPSSVPPSFSVHFDKMDQGTTFENFVIYPGNLLAHKLLDESCNLDKTSSLHFNPIYLSGRSGTGKTHLMKAATLALQKRGKKALYVRAETFTEHVVDAIRNGEMQEFRKAYRNIDALLIDDIEIFSRKAATQEEFFHTFNTLHVEGKHIILSASLPPSELKFIEPRLISRFEWGIVAPLQMPNPEEIRAILLQKAEQIQFSLHEPIITFLLDTFGKSTKTVLRALDALVLRSHLNQGIERDQVSPLSLKIAQNMLKDLILQEERALLDPGKIIRAVAEYYGIRIDDILSKSQARECALPRQIAMHLCREQLHLPFMKIGEIFERDHSTVMSSVKLVQKGLDSKNHDIIAPLNSILKLLA